MFGGLLNFHVGLSVLEQCFIEVSETLGSLGYEGRILLAG